MISLMIADDEAIVRNGLRDAIDWDALGTDWPWLSGRLHRTRISFLWISACQD